MYRNLLALMLAVVTAGWAVADEKIDVMVPVRQFVESIGKDDLKSLTATCTDQAAIVFDVPPFEWHGPGACARWFEDGRTEDKKLGISDIAAVLHKPLHVMVRDDRAYVVAIVDFSYMTRGVKGGELGSSMVFALQKGDVGWRITGMTLALR
jgi:ketosteroid isomerase-like protein